MAYNRTFWINGTEPFIEASRLNNIEEGIINNETAINTEVANRQQAVTELNSSVSQQINDVRQELGETDDSVSSVNTRVDNLSLALLSYVDGGYVENGVAYFTHGDEVLFEITGIGGGGGGGGGGNAAILTVTNTSGFLSKTISTGASCPISLTWSSLESEIPTGNGTLKVLVNGATRASLNIAQGAVTVDVSPYCSSGSNSVKIQVSDVYGNTRTINFTISVIALSISSTFDANTPYTGAINFPYTPIGALEKTVYFILDGTQIGTETTTVSNRQLTYQIPAQSHGSHALEVYFTATVDGETVQSNELFYDFIALEAGNTNTIISSAFNKTTAKQYDTLQIPYKVYNPSAFTAPVTIKVNSVTQSEVTVDRNEQTFTYRINGYGIYVISILSGGTTKTFTLNVSEIDIDVDAETANLALYLSSNGRSNQEEHPEVWSYNNISCTLSNFNWTSDGWQNDADGITMLRVAGNARVTIPYKIFETDFRGTGKTIELEFATRNVLNYDAQIISCMSGDRGLTVTAQKATLKSEQSEISTQYKEDEHVRIAFVVEKRAENRLLFIYINGVASGVVQYPTDDDFSQVTPVNISIGSNDCMTDIYAIRVYDNNLTRFQIVNNWIADMQIGSQMVDTYNHNNVFDEYGNIVIAQLPADLPHMVLSASELPQYKGDKKTISGSYTDPLDSSKSFTFTGAQIDVQGTSSQYYPRKNYKIKFKNGFVINGETVSKYAMNADAIPTNTFTMKADVASSEGANNVELARLYNDACPYKTPAQQENSKVRQGIDGFPIVIFWDNGVDTTFIGKYNFNNDKGTEEVFGFVEGDESIEIKNNTSLRVLWKSDDYSSTDYLNDFEWRYPDTDPAYTNATQLRDFATWAKSTDRTQATGNALSTPVTYDGVTYTTDSAEYRLAKFKAEAGNYMEMQSTLFYYLFTELFLMVDSRAKNAFPSFIGSEVQ